MLRIESVSRDGGLYTMVYRSEGLTFEALVGMLCAAPDRIVSVRVRSEESRFHREMPFDEFLRLRGEIVRAALEPRDTTIRFDARLDGADVALTLDPLDMSQLLFTTPEKEKRLPRLLEARA